MSATERRPRAAGADTLIRGGRIHVLDRDHTVVSAVAVVDGVIVAAGREAERLADERTAVLELDGRTALPGINDAHLHGAWLGGRWPRLFFGEGTDGGQPDGRLATTEADRRRVLQRAWRLLARLGITSYTEPGIGPGEDDGESGCFGQPMLDTYLALHREGVQTSRVTLLRLFGLLDGRSTLDDLERGIRAAPPATDPRWLAIPGVKIFADGIPPLCTAFVHAPYPDGTTGALLTSGGDGPLDAYRRMIALALDRGLQVAVHATGDRAVDEFLRVVEAHGAPGTLPHYVVHGDLVTHDLIDRLRDAGMGLAMQPSIAVLTRAWTADRIGEERAATAWPLDRMLESGLRTTITSDAPIADPDWRRSLDAALQLLTAAGRTDGADLRRELLHHMTTVPAEQDGAADWKGSLEVGKVADLCVVDSDPLRAGRPFADLTIETTVVGGRIVHDRTLASADAA